MFELMFCQLSDGTFDVEEIKKSRVYTLGKYNEELQDLLLNKFNQFIKENKILKMSFDKKLSLKLLALILYLNESIIRIIDNFDFVFSIPKIVIYLNGEDTIYKENAVVQYDDENNEYFYPGDKDNGYENMRNYVMWFYNLLDGIEDEELDRKVEKYFLKGDIPDTDGTLYIDESTLVRVKEHGTSRK